MARPKQLPSAPPIAKEFLEVYDKLWHCDDIEDMELEKWANTRTITNCGFHEYAIAQFILKNRKRIR